MRPGLITGFFYDRISMAGAKEHVLYLHKKGATVLIVAPDKLPDHLLFNKLFYKLLINTINL